MNKLFIVGLLGLFTLCVAQVEWAAQYRFALTKDQWASVIVLPEDGEENAKREVYRFRWTLYDTTNLIVHTHYRGFPKQHTLSLRRGLETVREALLPDPANRINGKTWLWLVFEDFDSENKVAFLEVYVQDLQQRILVEFDDPNARQEE